MLPKVFTSDFLAKLELMQLNSRRSFLGQRQGGHTSLRKGHGIEFSDFREYEPGDDPRHIDWNVYARSEKFYVRRFQEERSITFSIFIDSSSSMTFLESDGKMEYSSNLALAISYIALMQQDTVNISIPGIFDSPNISSAKGIHRLANLIHSIDLKEVADQTQASRVSLAKLKFPGVLIYISDFLIDIDELDDIFKPFRAKNLDIYAIQVLGNSDLEPENFLTEGVLLDSENKEKAEVYFDSSFKNKYSKALSEHNKDLESFFSNLGIPFLQTNTKKTIQDFMINDFSKSGMLG